GHGCPFAAYAILVLVNEVQLERGPEGFARGYLPVQYQRPKAAKSRHAVPAKPARQGWHPGAVSSAYAAPAACAAAPRPATQYSGQQPPPPAHRPVRTAAGPRGQ